MLPLKTGLEEMLCKIPETPVAVIPVGMSNGDPGDYHLFTPNVYIDNPIVLEPGEPREGLTKHLAPLIQECVRLAFVASDARAA